MTDSVVEEYKVNGKDKSKDYESVLFMARLILDDEDSLEDLREECSNLEFSSVLLASTFQSVLGQFNAFINQIVQHDIFIYDQYSRSGAAENPSSPFFEIANVIATILCDSQDDLGKQMSCLLTRCFISLEPLDAFTRVLSKKNATIKTKIQILGQDVENRISILFTLLIALMTLKESYHIEILFLQQFLSCEFKSEEKAPKSCIRNDANLNPNNAVLVKFLNTLHEYQQTIITIIKKAAITIDLCTFQERHSIFSGMVEDSLYIDQNLVALKKYCCLYDKKKNDAKKLISTDEFVKLSMVHIEKIHKLELAVIEEMENTQLVPDKSQTLEGKSSMTNGSLRKTVSIEEEPKSFTFDPVENNAFSNMSSAEIRKMIEQMSPELLRSTLISLLKVEADRSQTRPTTPLENIDEEQEDPSLPLDLVPVVNEWQVDLNELNFKKKIGNGGAGTTYLCKWRREDVAVKVAAASALGIMGWKKEINFLKNLHHPNVIRMLGCVYCERPFTMCIAMEFCDLGNLGKLLNRATPRNFFLNASLGLANGLSYLHNKGIIHRDIKPDNILVHGNLETGDIALKIIDFGLSVFFDVTKYADLRPSSQEGSSKSLLDDCVDNDEHHTAEAGTYRWMAPEIIRHEQYNFKCDVYSYAIVLWQMLTREKPYADKDQTDAAKLVAVEYHRPPFPRGTPHEIVELIERCWKENPCERPVCEDVCEIIEKLGDSLRKSDVNWLNFSHGHPVYSKMKSHEDEGQGRRGSRIRRSSGRILMGIGYRKSQSFGK